MSNYNKLNIKDLSIKMTNGDINAQNIIINYYINYINNIIETNPNNLNYCKEELKSKMMAILYKSINDYKEKQNKPFSSIVTDRINRFYNGESLKQQNKNQYKNREIQKLANRMVNGDIVAQNKIIEFYTFHIIKLIEDKYCDLSYEKEDLIQIGIMGLLKAINLYKQKQEYAFCSYAKSYIVHQIESEVQKLSNYSNIEYTGLINNYNSKTFDDFIENIEIKEEIKEASKKLTDIQRKVLILYTYGMYSFDEIGDMLGFSHQNAQEHYKKALKFIKQELNLQKSKQKKL